MADATHPLHQAILKRMTEERAERRTDSTDYADISRRLSSVEETTNKVYYAVFGLSNHNGLMGTTANLAVAISDLRKELTAKLDGMSTREDDRLANLQWKVIGALGAVAMLLAGALVAVVTHI